LNRGWSDKIAEEITKIAELMAKISERMTTIDPRMIMIGEGITTIEQLLAKAIHMAGMGEFWSEFRHL
jgi:hypothetical protein